MSMGLSDACTCLPAQGQYGAGLKEASTLQNLSAYLTLNKAKESYGFVPEK